MQCAPSHCALYRRFVLARSVSVSWGQPTAGRNRSSGGKLTPLSLASTLVLMVVSLLLSSFPGVVRAQDAGQGTVSSSVTKTAISSNSGPWHLEWDGTKGTIVRHAMGSLPEVSLPLLYLHTEPGPKGYAKYLTWFLARDNERFDVVWCYFNDSGHDFYCWLYQYPANQLTSQRFVGDYKFLPSAEPVAPAPAQEMKFAFQPRYNGPDFAYKNWSRRTGTLESLPLQPTRVATFASPVEELIDPVSADAGTNASKKATFVPTLTLTNLQVSPLHQIQVAQSNGWRKGGWRELHALALDAQKNPWYLILYSNATKGYAVDLKTARTFVADFGETVKFVNNDAVFGTKDDVVAGPPDVRIRRFATIEIPLTSRFAYTDPYKSVHVDVELRRPDGHLVRVPCFWDGGQTWRLRFAPTQVGRWSWKSISLDSELADQVGTFSCIADETGNKGFITTTTGAGDRHGFTYSNGTTFFPVWLQEPTFYQPLHQSLHQSTVKSVANSTIKPGSVSPNDSEAATARQKEPRSYLDFTARVDAAVAQGYNRFWGAYLLDPVQFAAKTQVNEGGAPFLNYDLDQLNPAYFQWMDRRIAYCNEHGVIPDISITDLNTSFLTSADPTQISRLWSYVLARYAAFNVTWNLFHVSGDKPYPDTLDPLVEALAPLTGRNDPNGHPLTTTVSNQPGIPTKRPGDRPAGPVTFTPDRPASVIPVLPGGQFVPGTTPGAQTAPAAGGPGGFGAQPPTTAGGTGGDPSGRNNRFGRGNRGGRGMGRPGDATSSSAGTDYVTMVDPIVAANMKAGRNAGRTPAAPAMQPDIRYVDSPWFQVITLSGGTPETLQYDYRLNRPVVLIDSAISSTDETRHRMWETIMRGAFWVPEGVGGQGGAQLLDDKVSLWQTAAARLLKQTLFARLQPHQEMLGGPEETPFDRRRRRQSEEAAAKEKPDAIPGGETVPPVPDPSTVKPADPGKPAPGTSAPSDVKVKSDSSVSAPGIQTPVIPLPFSGPPTTVPRNTGTPQAGTQTDTAPVTPPATIYVLSDPGWEYVIYFKAGGKITLDLLEAIGPMKVQWFNPRTGEVASLTKMDGGVYKTFVAPDNKDWVLYITRR